MTEKTPDDVFKLAKDENVEFVDVRFCDLPGIMQHFTIPISFFDESVFEGSAVTHRKQPGAFRIESHIPDHAAVTFQRQQLPSRAGVPDSHVAIVCPGSQVPAVGAIVGRQAYTVVALEGHGSGAA